MGNSCSDSKSTQVKGSNGMGEPALYYFDARGRAEHIRYLFAAKNKKFKDVRFKIGSEEWKEFKPKTPFGSVPVLEVGGKQIAQSLAVGRAVARMTDQYGSSALERAIIDSVADTANDVRESFIGVNFTKDESEKAEKMKTLQEKTVPTVLDNLTKVLGSADYFVGNKLSWADIHFYACFEILMTSGQQTAILDNHKELKKLYQRVGQNPGIAEYIKNRPETQF